MSIMSLIRFILFSLFDHCPNDQKFQNDEHQILTTHKKTKIEDGPVMRSTFEK